MQSYADRNHDEPFPHLAAPDHPLCRIARKRHASNGLAEGDRLVISAYYSGELYEQVFGDIDAAEMLKWARQRLAAHPQVVKALGTLLCSFQQLGGWIEAHVDTDEWGQGRTVPAELRNIFNSLEWQDANSAAATLIAAVTEAGLSSRDEGR